MRWYSRTLPIVGEIVMCTVISFDETTGFTVKLSEYDELTALLPCAELSRKKIKTVFPLINGLVIPISEHFGIRVENPT